MSGIEMFDLKSLKTINENFPTNFEVVFTDGKVIKFSSIIKISVIDDIFLVVTQSDNNQISIPIRNILYSSTKDLEILR